MTEVCFARTDILEDAAVFARFYEKMPRERREKIDRMRQPKDARLSLGAGALLQAALGRHGISVRDYPLVCGAHGKPALSGAPLQFNLSHSGAVVLCAVSDAPCGCDVQQIAALKDSLAQRFFHPDEQAALFALPEEERATAFYRIWTLKESYLKATGHGLSLPLSSFCVALSPPRLTVAAEDAPWFFHEYAPFPAYRFAVCAGRDGFPRRMSEFDFGEAAFSD